MQETNTNQQIPGEDSPAVLAYRVGQLEKSTSAGFKALSAQLDKMSCTFVTFKDLDIAITNSNLVHDSIKKDIKSIQKQKWIQNTLSAMFGAVLSLLISYAFTSILQ